MRDPNKLWRDITYRFAEQSKCRTRKVGCIIVSKDQRLIGQGYNGAPSGSSCDDCPRCNSSHVPKSGTALHKAICAHAEANAIGYAARKGIALDGCTLYCTTRPCSECAKLIVASGIRGVVYYEDYRQSPDQVADIFAQAGVTELLEGKENEIPTRPSFLDKQFEDDPSKGSRSQSSIHYVTRFSRLIRLQERTGTPNPLFP